MFQSSAVEVRDLGRVILRRRGVMVASVLGFFGLALALNAFTRPVYRTAARLEIQPAPSRSPLTGAAVESPTPTSESLTLLTTAERILSHDVLERVARAVEARGIKLVADLDSAGSAERRMAADVDWLLHAVSVRPVRDTRLVDIQAEHSDPRAAADIANTVAQEFVCREAEARRAADDERLEHLRQQASDVRRAIETSERALYGSQSASLALAGERSRQLTQAGVELGSSVLKARADLHDAEAQLERIRTFRGAVAPDWSNPPVQTPALDALYRELQQTEAEILAQRRVYREGSQELAPFESQAAALREAMRKELQKAFSDMEGQHESLAERAADLDRAISRNEHSIKTLSDSSYKYSTLESELGTQRDLYTLLLKKVQEQDVAQTIQPATVQVVQAAVVPLATVRPRKVVNLVVGLLLGLVFGIGLALAREAFRHTIRTPRDVIHRLRLPVMGMIPRRM